MQTHSDPHPLIPVLGIYVSDNCDVEMLAALVAALADPPAELAEEER